MDSLIYNNKNNDIIQTEDLDYVDDIEQTDDTIFYEVKFDDIGIRIDKLLSKNIVKLSRSQIQLLIESDYITVNNLKIKSNYKVKQNDQIKIILPEPKDISIEPENIPLDIIYEDSDLIVVNKARGMVVHPAKGHYTNTLVNALMYYCTDLSGINGELRPGIVHRLDKDTTGLLIVAKNDKSHRFLAEQFKNQTIERKYITLVHGLVPNKNGTIIAPIGRHKNNRQRMDIDFKNGKDAITHFEVIKYYSSYTLLELRLQTGRTHQIRVHLAHIGYPVAADPIYGYRKSLELEGQALHAKEVCFVHPTSHKRMCFNSDLPKDFQSILTTI